jgi:hypothetical protein
MSPVRLNGSTSGYSELSAPAVAGDQTFLLPSTSGTLDRLNRAGNILQVVSASATTSQDFTTTTPTLRVSLSLTPASSSNKVLLFYHQGDSYVTQSSAYISSAFYRNGSQINKFTTEVGRGSASIWMMLSGMYLDSPATTSAITYAVYHWNAGGVGTVRTGDSGMPGVLTAMEVAA